MMLTDMADVLRAEGLAVVEVDGWKSRGYLGQGMAGVRSITAHWTATNPSARGDYPTLGTILTGNAGTPGPLSQLGLGRGGTWYVCAAGLCNHAGVVDHTDHSNPWAIGVEAEYHPDQGAWPEVQLRSYERGCKALARHYRVPVPQILGHYEIARPVGRKQDPNTIPGGMSGFRERVTALLNGGGPELDATERRELLGIAEVLGPGGAVRTLLEQTVEVLLGVRTALAQAELRDPQRRHIGTQVVDQGKQLDRLTASVGALAGTVAELNSKTGTAPALDLDAVHQAAETGAREGTSAALTALPVEVEVHLGGTRITDTQESETR